jgi:hypothetical protein
MVTRCGCREEHTFYTATHQAGNEVSVQWLETFVVLEASGGFVLASMNCRQLVIYARIARSAGRRTGASALALLCAGLSLEALAFLAEPAIEASPPIRDATLLLVRSVLLAASAVLSALLLRSGRSRA